MALPADRRTKLLAALRTGLRLEVACAKLGIRPKDVEATGAKFRAEVSEAEAAGDAFVEAQLYERGLGGDAACLRLAIERRDRARGLGPEADTGDLAAQLAGLSELELDRLADRLSPEVKYRLGYVCEIIRFGAEPGHDCAASLARAARDVPAYQSVPQLEADEPDEQQEGGDPAWARAPGGSA